MPVLLRCVALAVAACLILAPRGARAQAAPSTADDAGSHFQRGVDFFKDGDYVAAMVEFKKAYELDPSQPIVLYNIGQTARELRSYSEALTALEKYLAEGGESVGTDRRKRVEGWVAELKEKVAHITFETNATGAEISVDDVPAGRTPLARPVVMNAGRRKITATREGYAPLTRYVDVAGTETKTIVLELTSLTAKGGGGAPGPGPGPGPGLVEVEHTAWPWVGLGVTAATGIATGVIGGLALGKKSEFEDALTTVPTTSDAIEAARSDARTFALTADVLGGLTGGFAVLTAVAFVLDYGRKPAPPEDAAAATVTARPMLGPGYVGVEGSF